MFYAYALCIRLLGVSPKESINENGKTTLRARDSFLEIRSEKVIKGMRPCGFILI